MARSSLPTGDGLNLAQAEESLIRKALADSGENRTLAAKKLGISRRKAYYLLDVVNLSPTATICLNLGAPATISGTTCAAGEISLPPLWHRSWEGAFIPTDALHAIASAASTPASVGAK